MLVGRADVEVAAAIVAVAVAAVVVVGSGCYGSKLIEGANHLGSGHRA